MSLRALIWSLVAVLTLDSFGYAALAKTESECLVGIELGNELIKKSPSDYRGYASRGCSYEYLKKYELAERDILKALSLKPDEKGLYSHLAVIYLQTGRANDAISASRKVIELGDKSKEAYNAELGALSAAKQYSECIKRSDEVLKIYPENGVAYYYRAIYRDKLGLASKSDVLDDLTQARAFMPGDRVIEEEYRSFKSSLNGNRSHP